MANDGLTWQIQKRPGLTMPAWVTESAFVALLLLVFVGLTPFEFRQPGTLDPSAASGAGDVLRQILYLVVFACLGVGALQRRALDSFAIVPASLLLLLMWCFASALWADVPGVVIRRAGLEFVVISSVMLGVEAIGPGRALRLLRYVLIGVLIVNWISIPIIPQAVHLPGEIDPSLVGDWRGLYFHKNIAGAVSALTAMVLLYFAVERRSRLDFMLALAAIGFTVMTRSKSSLGFLPVTICLGAIYRWAWRRDLDRLIVTVGAALLAILAVTYLIAHSAQISRMMENPTEFTGRSAIWRAELGYIADHPFLGSGYGTFADTGAKSPLSNYVDNKWIETVAHGHNGYLQLLVTTGSVGFALAMLALVLLPLIGFWQRRGGEDTAFKALLFAMFCFVVLHNLLESDYLEGDGPTWVVLLLVIAMLRLPNARRSLLNGRAR